MKISLYCSIAMLLLASLFLMGCGEDGKSITSPTAAAQLPTSTTADNSGNGICPYCTADPATCPYHTANSGNCPNGTCPHHGANPNAGTGQGNPNCPYHPNYLTAN